MLDVNVYVITAIVTAAEEERCVTGNVCLSVCLFVCRLSHSESCERISVQPSNNSLLDRLGATFVDRGIGHGPRSK